MTAGSKHTTSDAPSCGEVEGQQNEEPGSVPYVVAVFSAQELAYENVTTRPGFLAESLMLLAEKIGKVTEVHVHVLMCMHEQYMYIHVYIYVYTCTYIESVCSQYTHWFIMFLFLLYTGYFTFLLLLYTSLASVLFPCTVLVHIYVHVPVYTLYMYMYTYM